jgi:hypothetical protein
MICLMRTWKPTSNDLLLSAIVAVALPFLARFLYMRTGALIPMLIYYGLAWGISKWRRGSTGYFHNIPRKIPVSFALNVGLIGIALALAYFARIETSPDNVAGVILTGVFWATINAASEQMLWIYIFEAWDLRRAPTKKGKWLNRAIGLILFSGFVGMIHALFWVEFLHTVDSSLTVGVLFVVLTTATGYVHLVVWRKSNHMIFTFIPHFLLNLIPLFWTGYSIVPYLMQ